MFKELVENKGFSLIVFITSAYYANYQYTITHKFNFFYTLLLFFVSNAYIYNISPFIEKKFNIRKLANYHSRRENLFINIIVLTPFFLICYLLSYFVDITKIISKLTNI